MTSIAVLEVSSLGMSAVVVSVHPGGALLGARGLQRAEVTAVLEVSAEMFPLR